MNILVTKKKDDLVTPETINFVELVQCSNTTLSLNFQSRLIGKLNLQKHNNSGMLLIYMFICITIQQMTFPLT
jgi:hypothetical protein